jgi:hypothetical protein
MRVENKGEFAREFLSTLMPRSNENKSCMKVDDITMGIAKALIKS